MGADIHIMPLERKRQAKPKIPSNADSQEQSRRFIDMAREVEADETPGATDRAFEKVITVRQSLPPRSDLPHSRGSPSRALERSSMEP
jgi:hypothetical protein